VAALLCACVRRSPLLWFTSILYVYYYRALEMSRARPRGASVRCDQGEGQPHGLGWQRPLQGIVREAALDTFCDGAGNYVFLPNNKPAAHRDLLTCGGRIYRVLADSKDVVAGDCEKVFIGLSEQEFVSKIPQDFFEGLAWLG
jgi:hypothetical protein